MLSIIVPTYKEDEIIGDFIETLESDNFIKNINHEVIIVDDSVDEKTSDRAVEAFHKIKFYDYNISAHMGKTGKGQAIYRGIKEAKGNIICVIDADLEYHPKYIKNLYKTLINLELDIVVSVRKRKDAKYRKMLSKIYKLIVQLLLGLNFDTQSGLKIFKKETLKNFAPIIPGWSWDVDFLLNAKEKKYKTGFVSVPFTSRKKGESKISVKSSIPMFKDLLTLKFKESLKLKCEHLTRKSIIKKSIKNKRLKFKNKKLERSKLGKKKFDRVVNKSAKGKKRR